MPFPIRIHRGTRPTLEIGNAADLAQWHSAEKQAWNWLQDSRYLPEDESLQQRCIEKQYQALFFLDGILINNPQPTATEIQDIITELESCYAPGNALLKQDPGADNIIAAGEENAALGLGMLAQALALTVESQSATVFAGRQTYINELNGHLAAHLQHQLETLHRQFDAADTALEHRRLENIGAPTIKALETEANRNFTVMGLILFAIGLLFIAGAICAVQIHTITAPKDNSQAWAWLQWADRYTLYIALFSCLFISLRWAGRLLQDTWRAAQSAKRRWAILSVVLADKERSLITMDEKDRIQIRDTLFGDTEEKPAAKTEHSNNEDNLPIEALNKLLDLLKKARETVLPNKPEG